MRRYRNGATKHDDNTMSIRIDTARQDTATLIFGETPERVFGQK
jgi:hypothetical protein